MVLSLFAAQDLRSQDFGLLRTLEVSPTDSLIAEDSLTIVPGTLSITALSDGADLLHCAAVENNRILGVSDSCANKYTQPLLVQYRVFHFDLRENYRHLDTAQMEAAVDDTETYIGFDFSPFEREHVDASFRNLNYSGAFSRGFTVGNSQSLVLNSTFNMQMSGTLGDDIEVLAVISDENIPIQADGSTRQIQEFDRIFIELSKEEHRLLAGDIELSHQRGHFMRYHKKLKGLNYNYEGHLGSGILQTEVGASISQGKFARQRLNAVEGNQGPYRLSGTSGERFIVVLAGTESVFLDGRRLIRGLENDYIIDYNTAEIIFTYNTLVTKDSRIIVEFEYIDQNYSRSMVNLNTNYQVNNTEVYLHFFSEQDSRAPSGLLDLTREDIEILEAAGNQTDDLFNDAVFPIEGDFDPNRVQYKREEFQWSIQGRDTIFQIIQVSNDPEVEIFTAQFTDLGQGNGNYIRKTDARNGRVYEFVPPDSTNGNPRGRFEPVRRLTAPQKQQMTAVGVNHIFSKNTRLGAEVSMSNFDRNRFSEQGNESNVGLATRLTFRTQRELGQDSIPWSIFHHFDYEFVNRDFRILNPYRNTEFERDWNYLSISPQHEHWGTGSLGVTRGDDFQTTYEFSGLFRGEDYSGMRNIIQLEWRFEKMEIEALGNWLKTENINQTTSFSRPHLHIKRHLDFLPGGSVGFQHESENNQFYNTPSDSLSKESFKFTTNKLFIEQHMGRPFSWRASYTHRSDERAPGGNFTKVSSSENWRLTGNYMPGQNHQINITGEMRVLKVTEAGSTDFQPKRTILSRVEYTGQLWNGALRYGNVYEASSGQEPKVEFEYREVQAGEGQYTWIDLNEDMVQQVNEFFQTPNPEERTHIRLPIITDEFISVNTVSINQNLSWDPRKIEWGDSEAADMARRFSLVSNLRILRKTTEEDKSTELNPWKFSGRDTTLVSFNLGSRHTLFYNRGNPIYDIQLTYLHNTTTNEQVTGSEGRSNRDWTLRSRWNLSRSYSHIVELKTLEVVGFSDAFISNNFNLSGWEIRSESNYLFSPQLNVKAWYSFQQKSNTRENATEKGVFHDITTEWTFRQTSSSSVISARLSYINAKTEGPLNTPAAILILSGLSPGNNFRAHLSFEKKITDYLRMSLQYTGRKPGSNAFVHTGSMNATATF
nr:hypothetical protein [Saprospiraceae bacterium]